VGERGSNSEIQCDEQTINITLTSNVSTTTSGKGKVTMKCINCDQCFSGEIL
jgi:hypothetical protein